jgi:hypothetical protein
MYYSLPSARHIPNSIQALQDRYFTPHSADIALCAADEPLNPKVSTVSVPRADEPLTTSEFPRFIASVILLSVASSEAQAESS